MQTIAIIGGGFTGTMTAVQMIEKATQPFSLIIIDKKECFNKGVAYNPYSQKQLLNVRTSKMSAYPDKPNHFLEWIIQHEVYAEHDKELVANAFVPRYLYGEYLIEIWRNTEKLATQKNIEVRIIADYVKEISVHDDNVSLSLENDATPLLVDDCVIATGNNAPRNPKIENMAFYESNYYFQNPWLIDSVENVEDKPVLILGNGLTMVDTVLALLEKGFKNQIYTLSPNGFYLLPHRYHGLTYTKLIPELSKPHTLIELVNLVNHHIKSVNELGFSAEAVVDSMRPFTQQIWQNLTYSEKKLFLNKLKHLWSEVRHRIPAHIFDSLQVLKRKEQLHCIAGKLLNLTLENEEVVVDYWDKSENCTHQIAVGRVINCTGPDTNLSNLSTGFLKNALDKGLIQQDVFKLGICANPITFEVLSADNQPQKHLFTLGPNLRGILWESTAVAELRVQAAQLADKLVK